MVKICVALSLNRALEPKHLGGNTWSSLARKHLRTAEEELEDLASERKDIRAALLRLDKDK